jgi:hypothetical protein
MCQHAKWLSLSILGQHDRPEVRVILVRHGESTNNVLARTIEEDIRAGKIKGEQALSRWFKERYYHPSCLASAFWFRWWVNLTDAIAEHQKEILVHLFLGNVKRPTMSRVKMRT